MQIFYKKIINYICIMKNKIIKYYNALFAKIYKLCVVKCQKDWNPTIEKWQTDYIFMKTIRISKFEIFRGYPCRTHIVDVNYKISIIKLCF